MNEQVIQKLKILTESAKYDVSCASSGTSRKNTRGGVGNTVGGWGICHSFSEDGRCISLLKIMLTNYCIYDCAYCINRVSNDIPRATLSVTELVELTMEFYRRNYIEGLFLSSGVVRNPDYTMERLVRVAKDLRLVHRFNGYIHLKSIPGASEELVREAGLYADRLSVNLEIPTEKNLKLLAPEKDHQSVYLPMKYIQQGIQTYQEERKHYRHTPRFAPGGQSTQMIVGATPETDKDYAYQNRQDFGHHCFTYSLVGHAGGLDKAATIEKAEMLNQRLKAFRTDKHKGTLGKEFSFVSSNNRNVIIKALKKAENSDEYVVRVYEMGGEKVQDAVLSFAGEIASACEADGTEKSIGSAEFSGNGLSVSIKPYSIKTFKVRLKSSGEDAYQLQYASLPLSYNYKCSSFNEFRGEADFESGYSFAAELLPESLTVNGIPFQLGEKDAANGMTCNGDTIVLPEGKKYNKLYFLAAATDGDYAATFRCGGNKSEVIVPSYTGFVGQWGHSGHTKGYLKDAEVAYVGTHRHSPTDDEAYEFTYMFKFGIDIPEGAASLILPKNEKVVLFAATLVEETQKPVQVATTLFHTAIRDNEMELNSVEVEKENLLKGAKIIAYSGYFNDNEKPERIVDGDVDTKWCEVGSALNYVDFDLGEAKTVSGWKLVNAGREDKGYITSACFLQGRNSQTEEWKTLDNIDGNRQNVVSRMIDTPAQVRYVRLMITRPMQHAGGKVLRINEMEIY